MAKRNEATVRLSDYLEEPLDQVIREARDLEGRVVQSEELALLITLLEGLRAAALHGCGMQTWHRSFTLGASKKSKPAGRRK